MAAPYIFGRLVGDGKNTTPLFWGYVVGAMVMIVGGLIAWFASTASHLLAGRVHLVWARPAAFGGPG